MAGCDAHNLGGDNDAACAKAGLDKIKDRMK